MRVCVITSSFPANRADGRAAAGLFVKDFCLVLAQNGHEVTVVTPDVANTQKEQIPGIEVNWYPWLGGVTALGCLRPWRPRDVLALLSVLRQGRLALDRLSTRLHLDHVMAMWAVPAGWLARGLKRRCGVPYTTWCLGSDIWVYGRYPVLRRAVRSVLAASDRLYADGVGLAEEVSRLCGRACGFMPSGRMLEKSLARSVQFSGQGTKFLFTGRYARVKGVDVLLEAMSRGFSGGRRRAQLQLLGGGEMEAYVRERALRPDLRDCVRVGGFADEQAYVSYLNACDCVLIPSRMESIPVVLSDALQMGKPVIASDVGDMGDLLREIPAGIVVPPDDVDALCAAMVQFSSHATLPYAEHIERLSARLDLRSAVTQWLAHVS